LPDCSSEWKVEKERVGDSFFIQKNHPRKAGMMRACLANQVGRQETAEKPFLASPRVKRKAKWFWIRWSIHQTRPGAMD
jgi:hypothetical protein